jgi:hypothetical protein
MGMAAANGEYKKRFGSAAHHRNHQALVSHTTPQHDLRDM